MNAEKARVVDTVGDRFVEAWADGGHKDIRAIIMTGSMARGEATIRFVEQHIAEVRGDAEFIVVMDKRARLPHTGTTERVNIAVQKALKVVGIRCHISSSVVRPDYLRKLPPHVFSYELRACGRILWGDKLILRSIPEFGLADLSREDAWRMLSNRMIELLEAVVSRCDIDYRILKLYLDMATSLLVFVGAYRPTYRARAESLDALTLECDRKLPISLKDFANVIRAATEAKLDGVSFSAADLSIAVQTACALWDWQLRILAAVGDEYQQVRLTECCRYFQTLSDRLLGWASLVRRTSWQGLTEAPRWCLRLGASPRYWVYSVAREVFAAIPDPMGLNGAAHMPDLEVWAALPTRPESPATWRDIALATVHNYHTYLEGTRA